MKNKRMIVIPSALRLEHILGISGRKINAGVFIPATNNSLHSSLLESTLYQLKHLNIIDWFTNEVGYQRGSHRRKKLIDLCCDGKIDIIICYSNLTVMKCRMV